MAGLKIAATAPGFADASKKIRVMPRAIKTEMSRRGRTLAEPLAVEIRAVAHRQGSHAGRVATTVKSGMKAGVPTITAGGLPYTMGSEWGGQKRITRNISTTSRAGRRYRIPARHTTRQFRPYKGHTGYWFTPTIHEGPGLQVVLTAWQELLDRVIEEF